MPHRATRPGPARSAGHGRFPELEAWTISDDERERTRPRAPGGSESLSMMSLLLGDTFKSRSVNRTQPATGKHDLNNVTGSYGESIEIAVEYEHRDARLGGDGHAGKRHRENDVLDHPKEPRAAAGRSGKVCPRITSSGL